MTIRAQRVVEGKKDIHLSSYATFIGNEEGEVVINSQSPVNGTYSGVDGMGLFWSLEVTKVEEGADQSLEQCRRKGNRFNNLLLIGLIFLAKSNNIEFFSSTIFIWFFNKHSG